MCSYGALLIIVHLVSKMGQKIVSCDVFVCFFIIIFCPIYIWTRIGLFIIKPLSLITELPIIKPLKQCYLLAQFAREGIRLEDAS